MKQALCGTEAVIKKATMAIINGLMTNVYVVLLVNYINPPEILKKCMGVFLYFCDSCTLYIHQLTTWNCNLFTKTI